MLKDTENSTRGTKKLAGELSRYTVVGGIAFLIDFFLLFSLTEWAGLHYLLSATVSFSVGLVVNYYLSVVWVFSHRSCRNPHFEFVVFLLIGLGGLFLNDLIIAFLTPLLKGNYMASKIVAASVVYFWNFIVRKKVLFSASLKKAQK